MKKARFLITISFLLILFCIVCIVSTLLTNNDFQKLIDAIEQGDTQRVEQLLEKGVDPNFSNIKRNAFWSFLETTPQTPLAVACRKGDLEMVELLLEYGATAEYIQGTGWSPLRETLFYYHPDDVEVVKLLLENGADSNISEDELPVFVAADMVPKVYDSSKKNGTVFVDGYDENTAKGITEIVTILLDEKSVNITSKSGETLLIKAVKKENVYLVNYLVSQSCDVTIKDVYGKNALDYALENGNEEIIELLNNT